MANSITTYTDAEILRALLTHNFSGIGRAFEDDVVTSVKPGAFYQAQNLDSVKLSAATRIGPAAFVETALSTLELTWAGITSIGAQAFYKGWGALPAALCLTNVTELGMGAFAGTSSANNTRLTSVSMPVWTGTTPAANGFNAGSAGPFEYCSSLTSVSMPELTTMLSAMFRGCSSLTEITLPKVRNVASNAFNNCSALRKIDLGGEIAEMNLAFLPSSGALEALILRGVTTVPTIGTNVFSNTRVASGTAYVYVPKSLEALFKVASNWSTYSSQIRAIEDYPDVCGS